MSAALSNQPTIEDLVQSYHDWLRDRTVLKRIRQWTEITTPFLDRHNDYVQIYAARHDDGGFLLSDDANTLHDLEISGCPLDTSKRKELLHTTLNGFGVQLEQGAIQVHATADNFALRKHNLIQAVLAVNDLFYLATSSIRSLFVEDVTAWLDSIGVRYISRVKLSGKSGFDHVFDFAIPKSLHGPERLLKTITNPNRDSAQSFAFAWMDTLPARQLGASAYAFINDNEREVPSAVVEALHSYGIGSIIWSKRNMAHPLLAA